MCLKRVNGSTVVGFHHVSKATMDLYLTKVVLFISVDEKLNNSKRQLKFITFF